MIRLLCAAALAVGFAVPAVAEPHTPPCMSLEQSRVEAKDLAEKYGANLINLDGDAAHRYIKIVNNTGAPTSFIADHLSIFVYADAGFAEVVIDDSPCRGYSTGIKLRLVDALNAYRAAVGEKS